MSWRCLCVRLTGTRFVSGSLDALRAKKQRTVYRLTLVKGGNMDELADYVALVQRGLPDLIEVKGVTWCGTRYDPVPGQAFCDL